jgi:putative ABC transport system substrate-binding protein
VGLALAAGCGRLLGQAPPPAATMPRVGHLSNTEGTDRVIAESVRAGLRELGYVEGQNLAVENRVVDGGPERRSQLAAELVRLPVDLIIAQGPGAALAAKQATTTIPIVMAAGGSDPVGLGLVYRLARPGGNVTGVAQGLLGSKRLELLKEVVPGLIRVAVLWHTTAPLAATNLGELQDAGQKLGVRVQSVEVRDAEFESAMDAATREQAGGLVFLEGALLPSRATLAELAFQRGLPTMGPVQEYVRAGGLMAYSKSDEELGRRAAYQVDRILKGPNQPTSPWSYRRSSTS